MKNENLKTFINKEVSKLFENEEYSLDNEEFVPIVGMIPGNQDDGLGYKGIIEYVGEDYFVLRNTKSKKAGQRLGPILI